MIAELTQINTLPGAQIQAAVGDGYGKRYPGQARFGMTGHIVRPFVRMDVIRSILGHHPVVDSGQIGPHTRIKVFIDSQRAAGVLDKQVQHTLSGQSRQMTEHFFRNQMKATALRS